MSKRTVFTTITPLPAGISREVVLDFLHDHEEMIDLNPLVKERHPISPPPHASADELGCRWYSLTDKISYLPGGWAEGDVTYTCAFHDLPQGLQTHCYAPAGLTIRDKWSVGGSLPGEPAQKAELGLNLPPTGLYLREDVNMKCNVFMAGFVKKTLKKSHAHLVERLKAKAKVVAERANNNSPARVAADANTMRRDSNATSYTASGNSYHQYQHQQQQYFTGGNFTNSSRPHSVSASSVEREGNSAASSPSVYSTQMWSPGPQGSVMTVASPPMSLKSPPSGYAPFPVTNPPTTPPYPAAGGNNNSQANPPYPVSPLHPPATQPQQTHYRPYGQEPHQLPLTKARPSPAPQHLEPQTPFFQQQQPQDDWPQSSEPSTSISSFISYKKREPVPQPPAKITNLVPEALRVPAMASRQEKKSHSNDEIWKALGGRAGGGGDSTAAAAAPCDPYKPTAGYGNESTYAPYDKESKPAAYKDGNGNTFAAYNQGSNKNAAPNVNTLSYDYNINSNNIAASVNSLSYDYNSYGSRNNKANADSVEGMNSLSYGLNSLHVEGGPHKSYVRERSYSKGSNFSGDSHPDYPEMNPYTGLLPSQRKQEQGPEVRGPFVSELP